MKNNQSTRRRALTLLAALGLASGLGACDNLLEVQNPGAINDSQLNDPLLADAMVSTTISGFQQTYSRLAFAGAILTDEAVNGHNYEQWRDIDLRKIDQSNTILNSEIYQPLQAARFSADSLSGRFKVMFGDTISAKNRLGRARMLAYAGYSYILLGEYFCEAPINMSKAYTSDELLQMAVTRFTEVISEATTAKAAGAKAASADSLINLARVGTARAYLQLGNAAKAIEFAQQVPTTFTSHVAYTDNTASGYPNNIFYAATTGAGRYLGVDAAFRGLTVDGKADMRVQHSATSATGHNGLTALYTPTQSPSFTEWTVSTRPAFQRNSGLRLASGLEAQYIVAEAQGPTAATLAFVNARRKAASVEAIADVDLAGNALMAELRDQRRRDFFLDGHRLGDLRRYKKAGTDQFPSGAHPNPSWGNYGTATCFIPSLAERIGNPNYR